MAAPTKIDIVNSALIRLGTESIKSLTDNSKRARVMESLYPICRRRLLEDHLWNFAIKRAMLAKTPNKPLFDYQFEYQLPGDFLRVVREQDDGTYTMNYVYPTAGSERHYEIEGDKVVTDLENFELIYVYDTDDVAKFSASFTKALYLDLAGDAAYSITQNPALQAAIMAEREQVLANARSIGSSQDDTGDPDPNDFIAVRVHRT